MTDLLDIADIAERTAGELAALRSESGLDHFEGRSYRGWHHHVTLASAAHAHRTLEKHLGSLPATLRALP
jgi:SRSO17 transposase